MKKIYLSVCMIFVLLLVSCSSSTHPFEQHLTILKEKFPDASITVENATLTMKQTVDFDSSSLPINENSCDYIVYDRLDDLKSDLKLGRDIVFLGKKCSQSTQITKFDTQMLCTDFYTNTPVEVVDVYYGDIEKGETVTLKEYVAILTDETGTESIQTYGIPPIKGDQEYIFILTRVPQKTKEIDKYYSYMSGYLGELTMDAAALNFKSREIYLEKVDFSKEELMADLLENYYNEETADLRLDEKEECRKLLDPFTEKEAALKKDTDATLEELRGALDKERLSLLDRMMARYGQK